MPKGTVKQLLGILTEFKNCKTNEDEKKKAHNAFITNYINTVGSWQVQLDLAQKVGIISVDEVEQLKNVDLTAEEEPKRYEAKKIEELINKKFLSKENAAKGNERSIASKLMQ